MGHLHKTNEQKTLFVIILTLLAMLAEISYGYITRSMALLADGYHMATHALALSLTYIAYLFIKKFKNSDFFPNGTDKIGTLAAYTSALFLGLTGGWMILESIGRIRNPLQIQFDEALLMAVIGLLVNGACVLIMKGKNHFHSHHHKEDYNFKAAYLHILADVLTSVLAIAALLAGKYLHLSFLDPVIGILGGFMILRWATSLLKKTVQELIDMKKIHS